MITFKKVDQQNQIQKIADFAKQVFHETYDAFTPYDFVDEYLNTYQSAAAITKQLKEEKYHYFLLNNKDTDCGYLAFKHTSKQLRLSKLYILNEFRNKKIGQQALAFVNKFSLKKNITTIELEVSIENKKAINFYKNNGFKIINTLINYHHDGSEVKDFLMRKSIN
jgi:ribosomal protein S18 acetylase RimI-like enzyme